MTQQQQQQQQPASASGGKKKKQKQKQKKPHVPTIPEPARVRLTRAIDEFRNSNDAVYTFEAVLTKDERAVVHSLCRKRGMKSKSTGKGDQRRLSVYNGKTSVATKKNDKVTSFFTFSEEAKYALHDLFTRYPPDDHDMSEKIDDKHIVKREKRKMDDFFCKPSINKAQIAKKEASLISEVKKNPKLRQISEARSKLPITRFKDVIASTVESHQVVLISGETGCGKTTQVPQYLLDHMWGKGETCKIVCTQPRRISTISVAERISSERGETVGDTVGYKIRLESNGGWNSSIVFCTNGVLLRVLVSKGSDRVEREASITMARDDVSDITHIIVDEIHERDRFSDLMLAILRDTLPSYPHLRLVLMSATLDAERFSQYFGGCPIIRVPGFTYPVKSFYLEDVLSLLKSTKNSHLDLTKSNIMIEESKLTKEDRVSLHEAIEEEKDLLDKYLSTTKAEEIDVVLIENLLTKICTDTENGAILVFLPGWDDINRTRERLLAGIFKDSKKFVIMSLHSMVPSMEQRKVFNRPPHGCRKIVLSTNIAETSVTIDDVIYVIDSGRMKEKNYDPYNNVSTLNSSWISKASAKQREGRAGRCQPGVCYHLYSKLRAASLIDFQVPEIRRIPIEELCLQVKILDPDCKIDEFLQKTLDPPISETIRNAITVLQDIGALSPNEKLTDLGKKIGSLPVHPLTSKMLFIAILTNCLDPALTLACASDYKDAFTIPMLSNQRQKAAAAKSELSMLYGGYSDQLAIVAAFECWKKAKEKGEAAKFCTLYHVSTGTMKMLFKMRKQLQLELRKSGFIPDDVSVCNVNAHNPGVLRAVLVAGQYPMVGRLLPKNGGQRCVVETAGGNKVRLHPQSTNYKLTFKKSDRPLIVHDEVTRVDSGLIIRNCSLIGPLPLLMIATKIIVAPTKENDDENGSEEDIMSTPDSKVKVIVDRWLSFESTAIDVAQIYCLRERLSKAIMHKVTHPRKVLPKLLEASIKSITATLSTDGMLGIQSTTMVSTGENTHFLQSLGPPEMFAHTPKNKVKQPAPTKTKMKKLKNPSNPHPQPPSSAALAGPCQNFPARVFLGPHQTYPDGEFAGYQIFPAGAFPDSDQNFPAGALNSYKQINGESAYLSQISHGVDVIPSENFGSHGPTPVFGSLPVVHGMVTPSVGGSLKRRRSDK
ncbi:hypothetical protein LguiB_029622 [Lonicera macranthoides]